LSSYTAPTSAIRLRFGFSPRESRVLSFGAGCLCGLGRRRPKRVRAHHDPLAVHRQDQHVVLAVVGVLLIGRAGAVGVEGLEIDRRAQRQLLQLTLTQRQSGPFADLTGSLIKRPPR